MREICDLPLILFGGKGGTGKTVCLAATALHMAEKGRRTLVFSIDPQRSLSDIFAQVVSEEVTQINGTKNLYALQVNAENLLDQFKQKYREEILEIVSDATYLDKKDIAEFLELSLPGTDEVMALIRLMDLMAEKKFDLYILDTAPTGHTLRFLELPNLLSNWTKVLLKMRSKTQYIAQAFFGRPLRSRSDIFLEKIVGNITRIRSTLRMPYTTFIPVTTLEEMAVAETARLISFLMSYRISVENVIVNKVTRPNLGCAYCGSRAREDLMALQNLGNRFSRNKIVGVPYFPSEVIGLAKLREFAKALLE